MQAYYDKKAYILYRSRGSSGGSGHLKHAKNNQFAVGFSSLGGRFSVILDTPGAHFRSFWKPRELILEAWGLIWTPWAQI